MIAADVMIKAQFYDLDPMEIVWHGNYVRFFEQARCELLDRIGYNYQQMEESGFLWPVVDLRVKFIRPVRFGQEIRVVAELAEYENRIRIDYRVEDPETGEILTKGTTINVAVLAATGELCFETPACFTDKVRRLL